MTKKTTFTSISAMCLAATLSVAASTHSGSIKSPKFTPFTQHQQCGAGFKAPTRAVKPAHSSATPFTLTGDFDVCFYWYDFTTAQMSDTWLTSMYLSIESAGNNDEYLIKNFMREWLNPDPTDKAFTIAPIKASYDSDSHTFTLTGGQFLYTFDADGTEIDISLIGVSRSTDGKLSPDKNLEISFVWNGNGFRLGPELAGLLIGAETSPGRYGGLGLAYNPTLYPWNATMIYSVAPNFDSEGIPYTCNLWATVTGTTLSLANYADCGYTSTVNFTMDFPLSSATAKDASLQTLQDLNGNSTDLLAVDLDDYGNPSPQNTLAALLMPRDDATLLFQSKWGALFMGEVIGVYSNTYTIIPFDVRNPPAGINEIVADPGNSPTEYFDLFGRKVTHPHGGIFIKKTGNSVQKMQF